MKQKILFVDDDAFLLQGLKRLLRKQRNFWDMEFINSGKKAVELIREQPYDVVCTDMRMPEMNGEELLRHVKEILPNSIRLVLSGQADDETIFQTIGPAHQFLGKPCNCQQLTETIQRACHIKDAISSERIAEILSESGDCLDLSEESTRLIRLLQSSQSSIEEIAQNVVGNESLSLLLDAIAKSPENEKQFTDLPAFLGSLGIERSKRIIVAAIAYDAVCGHSVSPDIMKRWGNAFQASLRALKLMENQADENELVAQTDLATLLHPIGMTFLEVNHSNLLQVSTGDNADLVYEWDLQRQSLGFTHAELGATLLSRWGFSTEVIEAVLFQEKKEAPPINLACQYLRAATQTSS